MLSWLFKKGIDNKFSELQAGLTNSFSNIKEDMSHVSKWVSHFKSEHESHNAKFESQSNDLQELKSRVEYLEELLEMSQMQLIKNSVTSVSNPSSVADLSADLPDQKILDHMKLPRAQKRVCHKLALIQEAHPNKWILMKNLALEFYPGKEYKDSRSAISQLIALLEAKGYVAKKIVGKTAFVCLRKSKVELFLGNKPKKISKHKRKTKKKE